MGIILWVKSYSIVLVLCKSRPIWHPYLLVQVLFWHTFTAAPSCIINLLSRHERKVRSRPSEKDGPGGPSLIIIDQWRYSVPSFGSNYGPGNHTWVTLISNASATLVPRLCGQRRCWAYLYNSSKLPKV